MTNREMLNEMSNTELAAFICRFATREAAEAALAKEADHE